MKKNFLCKLLVAVLIVTMLSGLTLSASAAAENITIPDATYYSSGALQSMTTEFDWDTGGATCRLVLMTKKLNGGEGFDYGDFTDFGKYGSSFSSFDEVLNHDAANGTFGIITSSPETNLSWNSKDNRMVFNFQATDIPLNVDRIYYVYLWTYYGRHYYPDNLVMAISVHDGVVKYTPATGRNTYDESAFEYVVSQKKYSVTVTPAANMTKVSGGESQKDLGIPMTPVVYTAAPGYYFPEDYAVASVNGIHVTRDSSTQITVSGMPTADAKITLKAPTAKVSHDITCQNSGKAEGGSFSVDTSKATEGTTVTVTAKADSGYRLDKITVTAADGSSKTVAVSNGKFTMPDYAVTVQVSFVATDTTNPDTSKPATQPSEEATEPSEEPSEETTEPSEEPSEAPSEPSQEPTESDPPAQPAPEADNGWILWVVIAVVVIGAVVAVIALKKKK